MDWLFMHEPEEGRKAYLNNQVTRPRDTETGSRVTSRVLDSCIKQYRTYYAAVERVVDGDPSTRIVLAVVCLIASRPKTQLPFGFKAMDETTGPYESKCPERILKLLTPTDSKRANDWRQRCWYPINRRKCKYKRWYPRNKRSE